MTRISAKIFTIIQVLLYLSSFNVFAEEGEIDLSKIEADERAKIYYELSYRLETKQNCNQTLNWDDSGSGADLDGYFFIPNTGKSEYIIELATKIENGSLSKNLLRDEDRFETAKKKLMALRGAGKWTAEYVCLRCLKDPSAFPVDDIGLQNAVKQQLGLNEKPTIAEILRYASACKNWQAYATFYLWASQI